MTGEKLMDAMNYLPDEMLLQTDALRQKKKVHWKRWAALAACLCLAVSAWFMIPGAKSADSGSGAPEYSLEDGTGNASAQSGSTAGIVAYVYAVYDDHVTVKYEWREELCDCAPITVKFDNLEVIPQLSVGQKIRIYTEQELIATVITPYKIIIEED